MTEEERVHAYNEKYNHRIWTAIMTPDEETVALYALAGMLLKNIAYVTPRMKGSIFNYYGQWYKWNGFSTREG